MVAGLSTHRAAGLYSVQNTMTKPEQRWRPIALMPAFKFAISSAAETSRTQAENMRAAMNRPGVINRFELTRMLLVYEETAVNVEMCREQLRRWRSECLTPEQATSLDQLHAMVEQWATDTEAVIDAVSTFLHRK
jgi:hypothetical protein